MLTRNHLHSADVEGYRRLKGDDEEATIRTFTAKVIMKAINVGKMQNKIISMIVLLTFTFYLVPGCTKTTMMQKEKLSGEMTKCCVYEVVLKTGDKFEFEKPGGRYKIVPNLLSGTLNNGRKLSLDLTDENIKEIQISTEKSISRVDLAKNPDQIISEITIGNTIYTFDQNGGKLKAEVGTIHGIIKSGDEIDVPIEDILHVKVKRVSAGRTAAFVVGAILIVLTAVIIVIVKTTSPQIDFSKNNTNNEP